MLRRYRAAARALKAFLSAPARARVDHDLNLPLVTEESACMPLAVNVVARYWGAELPLDPKASARYPAGIAVMIEGVERAERAGLSARFVRSDLDGLKKALDSGVPPIVILPGVRGAAQHASVISGYDPREATVSHYVPKMEKDGSFHVGVIPEKKFDQTWAEEGRMSVLLAPPEAIPAASPGDHSNRLCFEYERHSLAGDADRAVSVLRESVSADPSNPCARSLLAGMLNEAGLAECEEHYRECVRLNPRAYSAHRGLGNRMLKEKKYAEAAAQYTDAISVNPSRTGSTYKNRAVARLETGDKDGARSDLREYVRLSPGAPDRESVERALREMG